MRADGIGEILRRRTPIELLAEFQQLLLIGLPTFSNLRPGSIKRRQLGHAQGQLRRKEIGRMGQRPLQCGAGLWKSCLGPQRQSEIVARASEPWLEFEGL